MKRKYMYLFCLFLLIPFMIEAKTITDYIPMLEENRIITEIIAINLHYIDILGIMNFR